MNKSIIIKIANRLSKLERNSPLQELAKIFRTDRINLTMTTKDNIENFKKVKSKGA
ncbi:MAG: hypothetical protein N2Z85_01815 [Patescibacteria group bacterium]|nr:hypothetical protein [Patescibacteria group bacterium]